MRWTGSRIDLKTSDGKTEKVAVNRDTERLLEIATGAEVTVEYRRRIGDFVIAQKVLPAVEQGAAPPVADAPQRGTVTGRVGSWSEAALILVTETGEMTLFLSPSTEYAVKPLAPGLKVAVEYQEGPDGSRLVTRVTAAAGEAAETAAPAPAESTAPPEGRQSNG